MFPHRFSVKFKFTPSPLPPQSPLRHPECQSLTLHLLRRLNAPISPAPTSAVTGLHIFLCNATLIHPLLSLWTLGEASVTCDPVTGTSRVASAPASLFFNPVGPWVGPVSLGICEGADAWALLGPLARGLQRLTWGNCPHTNILVLHHALNLRAHPSR